jgi:type VI secretion system secreted protein Hcp
VLGGGAIRPNVWSGSFEIRLRRVKAMPVDMFLKLAGIVGESIDAKHKGEIDVLAWSWGLSEGPPQTGGGGGGAGKVKAQDLSIQKLLDLASPLLLSYSAEGKHISDGTLTARRESKGGAGQEFLIFKMTNVLVTSVSMAETSKDEVRPTETVTLNFAKLDFDYRSFKEDGSVNQEKSFRWDFSTNKSF